MTESTYEFDLNMRPDLPAAQRGAVLVTAALMGDPTPEQRRTRSTSADTRAPTPPATASEKASAFRHSRDTRT